MKLLKIQNGKFTIKVDDEDAPVLSRLTLMVRSDTHVTTDIINKNVVVTVPVHYFLVSRPIHGNYRVIYKDGDHFNLQKSNLALVTHGVSSHTNKRTVRKSSQYKGVYWHKTNSSWVAEIMFEKKKVYLGQFKTEHAAALAYNAKAKELYGDYAFQNKIQSKGGENNE